MRTVPFVTSDPELFNRVDAAGRSVAAFDAALVPLGTADDALDFLNVETPDLAFVGFSDRAFDAFALLDDILKDPWLHHAGLIGFCADSGIADQLEQRRGINLIAVLPEEDIDRQLPRVLSIIGRNQRILSQRGVGLDLARTVSGSFQLENDTLEAVCYANLLCNFLFNASKVDAGGKAQVHLALVELLINAIEHGNCGITFAEKSQWLEGGNPMRDLIARKCQDPAVRRKRVLFEYTIAQDRSTFLIADEGDGFDWRRQHAGQPDEEELLLALHGRGIILSRECTTDLRYNEKGNEVRFEVLHQADAPGPKPGLFADVAPIAVEAGDIIFREGEAGDFLYYIAKGRYEVIVGDAVVSVLTPDDILMGEMAFLLNNRRTATIRAATAGTLIRMSKKDFVAAIKSKPHYGLFLSRLLAHKVERSAIQRKNEPEAKATETISATRWSGARSSV